MADQRCSRAAGASVLNLDDGFQAASLLPGRRAPTHLERSIHYCDAQKPTLDGSTVALLPPHLGHGRSSGLIRLFRDQPAGFWIHV
jgi:hypothetical protein